MTEIKGVPQGYKLGAKISPPDARDYKLKTYLPEKVILPAEFSYRDKMTPVKDQGQLGSCVAFASNAVLEYIHKNDVDYVPDLSEIWLYAKCKQADGYPNEEGTDLRTACNVMQKGVCEEIYFPYIDKYPAPYAPTFGADANANKFKLGTYAAANISELKSGLVTFSPLMTAIAIYNNFGVDEDGFMIPAEGFVSGGHAICCVGYKDTKPATPEKKCCIFGNKVKAAMPAEGYYEFKNSWSEYWGDKGYFKIRYSDLPKVFWEARSIVDEV